MVPVCVRPPFLSSRSPRQEREPCGVPETRPVLQVRCVVRVCVCEGNCRAVDVHSGLPVYRKGVAGNENLHAFIVWCYRGNNLLPVTSALAVFERKPFVVGVYL